MGGATKLGAAPAVLGAPSIAPVQQVRRLAWTWVFPRALYGAAAGLLVAYIAVSWPFTVDDAFITFRYSENLASGYGPTYNPGALPHAEGYTSFLWMVVIAVPHLFGWDAVLVSKLLGIAATLCALAVAARFVYDLTASLAAQARQAWAAFVVLLLAAYYPTAVHAVAGMETSLF